MATASRELAHRVSRERPSARLRYATEDLGFFVRGAAERVGAVLTPLRLVAAVAACALIALIAAQFFDYRSVSASTDAYAPYPGIEAPSVDRETASFSFAHGAAMAALALAALVAIALTASLRARLGLVVAGLALVALAIALAIDLPAGLDEGDASVRFSGIESSLEHGLWIEVVAAGVLALCGALLVLHGRDAEAEGA